MRLATVSFLAGLILVSGSCGGDDDGGGGASCADGCAATLAAACSNGPTSQTQCEMDCTMLLAGSCGAEYQALIDCGSGKMITCSASGLPTITGCTAEQDTFIACLNP